MAETLVLANLSLDASGLVPPTQAAVGSANRMEAAFNRFKSASLPVSQAIRGLGFNIVGLGGSLKTLGPLAAAVIPSFLAIRAAMRTDEVRAFANEWAILSKHWASAALNALGITKALNFLTGGMKEANAALEFREESFLEALERMNISNPLHQLGDLSQILGRIRKEASASELPFFLKQVADQAERLQKAGVQLPKSLASLIPPKVVKDMQSLADHTGTTVQTFEDFIDQIERASSSLNFFEASNAAADLGVAIAEVNRRIDQGGPAIALYASLLERLLEIAEKLKEVGINVPGVGEGTKVVPKDLSPMQEWLKTISVAQAKFEAFQIAIQGVASTLADVFTRTGGSVKSAVASMLKDLSRLFFVYALSFAAMAIAASTGAGAVILQGTPAQFAKASAGFAAAGVAAGFASRALGGGQESGASGGGGGRSGGFGRGGSRIGSQSITVVVQGSVEDPDSFARKIARLLRTAEADGAA